MPDLNDSDELKDLIKRKSKISKDSSKVSEYGDVVFRIGYLYYEKGYYKEALHEFEQALEIRKKLPINVDIAITHRFIGETISKVGNDFERAKRELDMYHSITFRIRDLVENQRSYTTLGNYFMALAENNYKGQRTEHLNAAYSHYLKSYELLSEIAEKKLVDSKEFGLMKARTCLNCAFVLDEKRDLVICSEYLKSAIEICESNHFYEDLIRCLYIKCDQAKRKNKMEEMLKTADRIIETTVKTKDFIQQSHDFSFVADIYLKIQNLEKAKVLLRKAYKLKKKCHIDPVITRKLKEVMNIIKVEKELNLILSSDLDNRQNGEEDDLKTIRFFEKLGDSYCNIGIYEIGLKNYFEQLKISKKINRPNSELAVIYASIAQTNQDLDRNNEALKYFELELNTFSLNTESECKSLLNIALLKEKLHVDFEEVKQLYTRAYEKAREVSNIQLQLKAMNLLKDSQKFYGLSYDDTQRKINALVELNKIKSSDLNENSNSQDSLEKDEDDDEEDNEDDENESLVFSSESDDEELGKSNLGDEEKITKTTRSNVKRSIVKRNLRGETQLHVACIRGNLKQAKKLIEEGHPINERDNLNWLPIHEACNYGHVEIVDLLIKHGAKINDSIGPITPLHDAAQNGHLEVVKLLLKAGALTYVFNNDGYTPLDYLCKYKEENEKSLSPSELTLINQLHDFMLNSIRTKDKLYKVKKVVLTEDHVLIENNDNQVDKELPKASSRKKILDLDSQDEDEDDVDEDDAALKKKKNSVRQYKDAINQIGSKSSGCASLVVAKKMVDKVIISEAEYNLSDKWLINDIEKKSNATKYQKNSSSVPFKRKYNHNSDLDEDDELQTDEYSTTDKNKIVNRIEDSDDDFDIFIKNKKSSNNISTNNEKIPKNPLSKKRFVDSNYEDRQRESIDLVKDTQDINLNDGLQLEYFNFEYNNSETYIDSSSDFKPKNDSPPKLKDRQNNAFYFNNENSNDSSLKSYNKSSKEFMVDVDLTITSPFKSNNASSKTKKVQLKLDKMQNYNLKPVTTTGNHLNERQDENRNSSKNIHIEKEQSSKVESVIKESNQNWKIKAIIDNRNFLIPVPNINASIDTLTSQIVTRYKTIFSNDPTYREPEKVILKSSDDLILFGQDLIQDVLTNFCQVHLIIESFKNAPKISEIYEQTCMSKNLDVYTSIQSIIKESETNFSLDLKDIRIDLERMSKQFYVIFESIKISSKHKLNSDSYFSNLIKIDLSSNMLNDEIIVYFIENVLIECLSLKTLNLSFNIITVKSLKALCEMTNSIKCDRSTSLFPLENLNLNGNDFAPLNSNLSLDMGNLLSSLISSFQSLKSLHISDCKLNFTESLDNSCKKMFTSIKNSRLTDIDISFNNLGYNFLSYLVQNLPESQIENINFSNCLFNNKSNSINEIDTKMEFFSSITKFISFNLREISLRNLNLDNQQTTDIISCLGACVQLRHIDLSYNYFEKNLIKLLFSECVKLEESLLVNNNDIQDESTKWCDIIAFKFEECSVPLKRLEIRVSTPNEKHEIKSIFSRNRHKSTIKCQYFSKNIIELIVN